MPTIEQTQKRVRAFVDRPTGWHFGSGVPSSHEVSDTALAILEKAEELGFDKTDAFLGVEGEIQVTVYRNKEYYEFTIGANHQISFAYERERQEAGSAEGLNLKLALGIFTYYGSIWDSSESFMETTTTERVGTPALHLRIPAMVPASPSLTETVLSRLVSRYARTSRGITETSQTIPPFTGRYQTALFPKAVSSNKRTATLATLAITT